MTFGNKCYFFFKLSELHHLSKTYHSYLYNRPNNILHICLKAVEYAYLSMHQNLLVSLLKHWLLGSTASVFDVVIIG